MTRDQFPTTTSRAEIGWAVALTALAVSVRLPNLYWGLPHLEEEALPMKKAFEMWGWGSGSLQLDPQTAGWPSLSFYVHLVWQQLHFGLGRVLGSFGDRYDFYLLQMDMSPLVMWARALGVVAASGVVWIGTRLGFRLAGAMGAILVGGSLALSPLLVAQAQLITPDILQTFLAALAVWQIVALYEGGRSKSYIWAGFWIGLGASCKYTPLLLAPSLYFTHMLRLRVEGKPWTWFGLKDQRLWLAALACVLAFIVTSPYVVVNLGTLIRDLSYQSTHMSQGHFGHQTHNLGYVYYLKDVAASALGWPGTILAMVGLLWAAATRRGVWLVILFCLLPSYLVLGSLSTHFDRYFLPMLLPLSLGLAGLWVCLRPVLQSAPRLTTILVAVALVVLLMSPQIMATWQYHQVQGRPSTQQLAADFLQSIAGADQIYVATEVYGPNLPRDQRQEHELSPVFEKLSAAQRQRLLDQPGHQILNMPFVITRIEWVAFYYDLRHLLPYGYIVTSSAVRARYEQDPQRFPRQMQFYADLQQYTVLIKTFSPGQEMRGPKIRIYRFDSAGKRDLLHVRGVLANGFYTEHADRLYEPQFHSFLAVVARHAVLKGQWTVADLYYQAMYDTYTEDRLGEVLPFLALTKLKTGQLESAHHLYTSLLERDPGNVAAEGYLGLTLEKMGDLAGARDHYQRCIRLGRESMTAQDLVQWAQQQLINLQDGPAPEPGDAPAGND